LVVVVIILLVSAVTLPVIIPALASRQISEGARILQAALAGARDAAIRANAPRGLRFIPDPLSPTGTLTYSRIVPIEPGPDYSEGLCQIVGDLVYANYGANYLYYSPYPNPINAGLTYAAIGNFGKVLRVEECAYTVVPTFNGPPTAVPNAPTNWWWNVRVGDKIRIGDSGRNYTIVGPLTIYPSNPNTLGQNPDLFVNDGPPTYVRNTGSLYRDYPAPVPIANPPAPVQSQVRVEFLYVVNGQDDNNNGFIDDGWDGINNNLNFTPQLIPIIDEVGEWESEQWIGSLEKLNVGTSVKTELPYVISRRPVVSPGGREITLPGSVVIDATTWNSPPLERSRLPVNPNTLTVEFLLDQSGQLVANSPYSSPSNYDMATFSFYHFWIADRGDVYDPMLSQNYTYPRLPMPSGAFGYPPSGPSYNPLLTIATLKKDRALVTLHTKSGRIATTSLEQFDVNEANLPYRDAQLGITEAK
jgi:hypothetical protein